jgi:hypothetical protein
MNTKDSHRGNASTGGNHYMRNRSFLLAMVCGFALMIGACSQPYQSPREEEWRQCLQMKQIDPAIDCTGYGIRNK